MVVTSVWGRPFIANKTSWLILYLQNQLIKHNEFRQPNEWLTWTQIDNKYMQLPKLFERQLQHKKEENLL